MPKSKWETHVKPKLVLVEGWSRNGLSEEQIAKNLGVAYSTFREYKKHHSALSAVLEKGREVIDFEVEGALIKKALGYTYDEITRERIIDPETGESKMVETKRVTKTIPPDTAAAKFWLNNRKPNEWAYDSNKLQIDREILKIRQKELEAKLF